MKPSVESMWRGIRVIRPERVRHCPGVCDHPAAVDPCRCCDRSLAAGGSTDHWARLGVFGATENRHQFPSGEPGLTGVSGLVAVPGSV